MNATFRILTKDQRIKYAGTDHPSWLTIAQAKKLVDYTAGERIYEYCPKTGDKLWEIL